MPGTKFAVLRYKIINRVLVSRKQASLRDLQQAILSELHMTISERQIKRDIEAMRYDSDLNYNAPIDFDRRQGVYVYTVKGYSIDKLPLNQEEVNALILTRGMLGQFRNADMFENVEGAIQKIVDHMKIREEASTTELSQYIEFENLPGLPGSEFLNPLLNAIRGKQVIKIMYQAFYSDGPKKHIFHPYLLKEYLGRWYIFGYEDYHEELRTYGLERIKSISVENGKTFIPPKAKPKEYFRHIIGVTRFDDTRPEKIRLKFTRHQAPYVLTKPLHESQVVEERTEEYTIISLMVNPSPELEIIILGWHSEVEVLEPEHLRQQIAMMHAKAAGFH
jgi:predicted DNA-binding transcriptional regulator YafY